MALYDALAELTRSPVVELNRAVAIAMAGEPEAGLEIVDELVAGGALDGYHLLARRARRPAGEARPHRRGARRVRAGRLDDQKHAGSEISCWSGYEHLR